MEWSVRFFSDLLVESRSSLMLLVDQLKVNMTQWHFEILEIARYPPSKQLSNSASIHPCQWQ